MLPHPAGRSGVSDRVALAETRAEHAAREREALQLAAENAALREEVRELKLAAQDRDFYKDALESAEDQLREAIKGIESWKAEVAAFKAANPTMETVLTLTDQVQAAQDRIFELERQLERETRKAQELESKVIHQQTTNPVSSVIHLTARLREYLQE